MTATPPVPDAVDLPGLMKQLGSWTAMLLGIGYVSGFIVYQSYLGSAGVVPLGLVSVQYLVAGMLFVGGVAFVWVPAWIGEMVARSSQAHLRESGESAAAVARKSFPARVIGQIGGGLLFGGLLLYLAGVNVGDIFAWIPTVYIAHVLLRNRYWFAAGLGGTGWSLTKRFGLIGFPLFGLILIALAAMFGTTIYPQIDRALGGGRPVRFKLELATVHEPTTGVYDVLAVTDRQWIIRDTTATSYFIVSSDQVKVATLREEAISAFGKWFRRHK